MDPLSMFLYFGVPTLVGLIGLAAAKLHERSAPAEPAQANPAIGQDLSDLTRSRVEDPVVNEMRRYAQVGRSAWEVWLCSDRAEADGQ